MILIEIFLGLKINSNRQKERNIATRYALLNDFESSTKIEIMNRPFAKPKIGQ